MRRDLLIPAAAFAATVATGLAFIVRPAATLYLLGSLIGAAWWFASILAVIFASAFVAFLFAGWLTDRDRKRRVREGRGVWR